MPVSSFDLCLLDDDLPPVLIFRTAGNGHGNGLPGQRSGDALAPFHGADAASIEVILPADVEELVLVSQAVHIKVEEREPSLVLVDDGEGGAGDAPRPPR